jgi:hypothetical protein
MTRVVELNPFYVWNFINERLDYKILRNIPATIDYQGFGFDCCEPVNYCPAVQDPEGEGL